MRPVLQEDDIVLFHRRFARLEPGDIVVFRSVVHRLVWIDGAMGFWEIGDANAQWPRRISRGEVEGVVFLRLRGKDWTTIEPPSMLKLCRLVARAGLRTLWSQKRALNLRKSVQSGKSTAQ